MQESSRLSSKRARDLAVVALMQSKHEASILEIQRGCLNEFLGSIQEAENQLAKQKGLIEKGLALLETTRAELASSSSAAPAVDKVVNDATAQESLEGLPSGAKEVDFKAMSFDQIYKVRMLPMYHSEVCS